MSDLSERRTTLLRVSIGVIYIWFGVLKFFPDTSPAENLAKNTIDIMTFGLVPGEVSIIILAIGESLIGIFLTLGLWRKLTVYLALSHMFCTFLPLVLLPGHSFNEAPFTLTLVGQYIMKNLVIISALLVIYPSYIDWDIVKRVARIN